ncbi:MAG: trimeric intracellular cation channel family protein [Paracoccus sp. (in: a-proteobacteria)]|uniref:trimeric intracellular cation channel family protein n=1 Tax=Paracoccus sp. TaxID=267 RepID=UPI0026E050E5|nr:trimeric intracellular cation channel family protein [Paracoccus sp. (in: a-proteobacteria)]MDO5621082.1 trimeric intracellular cation channel family protein [Paracoccus sp. (in: a-proteobacteria)]
MAAQLLPVLDHLSVLIFALTGALVASRAQLDPVGFVFFAALTGVGGGTLRDVVLDRPVFWLDRPAILLICVAAAALVFFTAHLLESRYRALLWLDAAALAVAVPAGVGIAQDMGAGTVTVIAMGVMTGSFGGLMRDVVANEVPLILKQGELYITAAFGGAIAAETALALTGDRAIGLLLCAAVVLVLRAGSLQWGWRLPVYRPRPPKVGPPRH